MNRKINITILVILEGILLWIDYCCFGIIYDFWYILFGVCLIYISKTKSQTRRKLVSAAVIAAFAIYLFQMPVTSYRQAAEILCQKENYDMNMSIDMNQYRELSWDYEQCKFHHPNYLIGFKDDPITVFWYDPYNGEYGILDIAEKFPFILEEHYN